MTHSDCIAYLRTLPDASVDSCVTDPPYELGFMGKKWDSSGIAYSVELWREVLRVLKPGAHLLAFGGTRTHHRMVCAIEDAGFEIRDEMQWLYGSGFPKSLDVSKAIDKAAGAERDVVGKNENWRPAKTHGGAGFDSAVGSGPATMDITAPATAAAKQWDGWGTALKPACEPICVARKPLCGTVAANVLAHGTGGINVDGSRIDSGNTHGSASSAGLGSGNPASGVPFVGGVISAPHPQGRWPANVILSHAEGCVCTGTKRVKGSDAGVTRTTAEGWGMAKERRNVKHADADGLETVEAWQCVEGCPVRLLDAQSGERPTGGPGITNADNIKREWGGLNGTRQSIGYGDTGGASRFFKTFHPAEGSRMFYSAKTPSNQRLKVLHCDCEAAKNKECQKPDLNQNAKTAGHSQSKAISDEHSTDAAGSSTSSFGSKPLDLFQQDSASTTSTKTSRTTDSKTCGLSALPSTSESTADASCETASGGSRAESAESENQSGEKTGISPAKDGRSTDDASPVISESWLKKSACGKCGKPLREVGHATQKPLALMRYLVRLVTPPGGVVLDMFAGSGTTLVAARQEGFRFLGCDADEGHVRIAQDRLALELPFET